MQYPLLIAFAFLLSGGQILFKKAAMDSAGEPLLRGLLNWWMLVALVVYGVATVLWVAILRNTPLSVAYPFAALGFVIVPLAARLMFSEPIDLRYAAGAVLIVIGIALTAR